MARLACGHSKYTCFNDVFLPLVRDLVSRAESLAIIPSDTEMDTLVVPTHVCRAAVRCRLGQVEAGGPHPDSSPQTQRIG
jgi:hypothetical protein